MKKALFIILVTVFAAMSCTNQTQNLSADVEIPVSVADAKPKAI